MTIHPVDVVLDRAMDEQSDLTFLGTVVNPDWEDKHGPSRSVRMPISENAIMGMAVGLAITGRRAIVDLGRAAFLYTAMDPLVNQATKWRYLSDGQYSVPLLILAITRHGENSGPQHEHMPHAMLSQVPGLVIAVPSSPNAAAGLVATALGHPDPVIVLQTSRIYFPGWDERLDTVTGIDPLPFGSAACVRSGSDVSLVGIGNTVIDCLEAATVLAEQGVSAQVIDLRTAAPLDRDGVAGMVALTGTAVLVDETIGACSLMRDIGFHLLSTGTTAPDRTKVLESAPCPVPASPRLQEEVLPGPAQIVTAARDILSR